ncbi:fibroblast growth factor 1 [Hydra vulgaris]|uniref:fibroblast growth factor 1 n=1 Tax=Hydra vulgaris TaxID=6087 RepID=UPI001F5FC029|nr:fibroblast growth factor 1-like [Hydra vulgaris]
MPVEKKSMLAFIVIILNLLYAKTENSKKSSLKLIVQVLPPATFENKTHQKNEKQFDLPQHDWDPRYLINIRRHKKKMRRPNKRAKINHDLTPISEFPTNKRFYKLANKLSFFLRIKETGEIDGTLNPNDETALLVFESHGPSVIRIKGVKSNRYLRMNKQGMPTAEHSPPLYDSLFRLNHEENAWDTFASFKFYFEEKYDMLVGITKEGSLKNPLKASPGQYATQFLSIPCD